MITLNEIAYNIKNLAYGGKNTLENNISTEQIKHWIHYHRAKLISDNFNKGIKNNQAIYQTMELTAFNSYITFIRQYIEDYLYYKTTKGQPADIGGVNANNFLENHPTDDSDELTGSWLAFSPLSSAQSEGKSQHKTAQVNWYGEEIASSQIRGDFRNFGHHNFAIPKPLQLQNDEGIKDIRIKRIVHNKFATANVNTKYLSLYRKEYGNFDEYNKFTNNSKPYYTQLKGYTHSKFPSAANFTNADHQHHFNLYDTSILSLKQLQVSPDYFGNKNLSTNERIFWRYEGEMDAILEDPTSASLMWRLSEIKELSNSPTLKGPFRNTEIKPKWNDSKEPYPIPMEYVSDLIQRVVQVEMQTELKTQADEITDGLDDNIKRKSGTQAQR